MHPFISIVREAVAGRKRLALLGLTAALGLAPLAYQHSDHVIRTLPYLMLLACPLAHLFMFHGHGGDDNQADVARRTPRLPPSDQETDDA